jgi:hypothetical protein
VPGWRYCTLEVSPSVSNQGDGLDAAEYHVESDPTIINLRGALNPLNASNALAYLGSVGWELVTVAHQQNGSRLYYFKQPA